MNHRQSRLFKVPKDIEIVVSNIFGLFHRYLGKIPILTSIVQKG